MHEITILDYILLPIYLLVLYAFAYVIRNHYYKDSHPLRKYFIPGLTVKLLGAILIGLIYHYYYKGGDTFDYFYHIKLINGSLKEGVSVWWRSLTNTENVQSDIEVAIAAKKYYVVTDTITIWQISSILALFCFSLYLPLSVIIAFLSFSGTWQIFKFFYLKYPQFIKPLAFTTLYIPTTVIWGSGLFKDTFCQMAIGWILINGYYITQSKKITVLNICTFLLGAFLLYKIKIYIFMAFLPLMIVYMVSEKIISSKLKRLSIMVALIFSVLLYKSGSVIINFFISESSKYSLSNIAEYTIRSRDYLLNTSNETDGSSFDLGSFEPSFSGLLSKFWPSVNATLFRPYIWESKKVLVLLSAMQSLLALILTLVVVFRLISRNKILLLFNNTILFCLVFSIIFAFMLGISTSNFGSLSRYKIPLEPFFYSSLIILYFKTKRDKVISL